MHFLASVKPLISNLHCYPALTGTIYTFDSSPSTVVFRKPLCLQPAAILVTFVQPFADNAAVNLHEFFFWELWYFTGRP
jgi:hypothetical protein